MTEPNNLMTGKQTLLDIQTKGILLSHQNNGQNVYTKKIRIRAEDIKNPICLKQHTNNGGLGLKDYKQWYYVKNDENYLAALYRGIDTKGKVIGDCDLLNLLTATQKVRVGNKLYESYMMKNQIRLDLYKVLKIGKTVILQESSKEDVLSLSHEKLWNRMYRIAGLSKSDRYIYVKLTHIMSSNPWIYISGEHSFDTAIEFRRYQVNNFIGLVEGEDFTISPTGKIITK